MFPPGRFQPDRNVRSCAAITNVVDSLECQIQQLTSEMRAVHSAIETTFSDSAAPPTNNIENQSPNAPPRILITAATPPAGRPDMPLPLHPPNSVDGQSCENQRETTSAIEQSLNPSSDCFPVQTSSTRAKQTTGTAERKWNTKMNDKSKDNNVKRSQQINSRSSSPLDLLNPDIRASLVSLTSQTSRADTDNSQFTIPTEHKRRHRRDENRRRNGICGMAGNFRSFGVGSEPNRYTFIGYVTQDPDIEDIKAFVTAQDRNVRGLARVSHLDARC